MALCASGEMSLAGSVVGRSVACELGCSGTGTISMDRADVRALAGRPGAGCAICMCDFYGKSSGPTLGGVFCGGYYMGAVASPANYYIVIAPNATGCACCQWKVTTTTDFGTAVSTNNGYLNTYNNFSSNFPAMVWTATRSINGYSDWYLPSRDELNLLRTNRFSLPAGEGFPLSGNFATHWSSTGRDNFFACGQNLETGLIANILKTYVNNLRAIRREPF